MNEAVVEEVPVRDPVRRVIRLLRLLQQNPWLQLRPVLFPDPSEFKFLFFGHWKVQVSDWTQWCQTAGCF